VSLYNMLFGEQPTAPVVLTILGITRDGVPRYRDAYFTQEGGAPALAIHTRTGGGNRDFYDEPNSENEDGPWNSDLRALPGFLRDEDDDYDSTYATFYFEVPEGLRADVAELLRGRAPQSPSERWQELFAKLRGERS
jgi:hypothetical protein